jgi:aspartate racemase
LHQLIYDVKTFGANSPEIRARFRTIINSLESHTILLACTELPLIPIESVHNQLVDVTELVAHKLAALANSGPI